MLPILMRTITNLDTFPLKCFKFPLTCAIIKATVIYANSFSGTFVDRFPLGYVLTSFSTKYNFSIIIKIIEYHRIKESHNA